MSGLSGNLGYKSQVFVAATAGTQLGVCSPSAATSTLKKIDGFLHTITVSADSTANTISVYDGTSTAGTLLAQILSPTTQVPQTFTFDIQAQIGLFIVISGATTVNTTVTYA
jgi:hypothetical protein